jgi:hypothetical protein
MCVIFDPSEMDGVGGKLMNLLCLLSLRSKNRINNLKAFFPETLMTAMAPTPAAVAGAMIVSFVF